MLTYRQDCLKPFLSADNRTVFALSEDKLQGKCHIQGTRCFIILSMITNIYNKKTKGHTLLEFFTATGKLNFFLQLQMFGVCTTGDVVTRDVRCVHHGWHGTQRYDIQVLATHASTWVHRYSSPLQWSVPLGQQSHVTMLGRILCTKCTLHSNHRLTAWYSDIQNDFSPGTAIFSIHTLASPSGRNANYDEKQVTGWRDELSLLSVEVW